MWELLDAGQRLYHLGVDLPEVRLLNSWTKLVDPTLLKAVDPAADQYSFVKSFAGQSRSEQKKLARSLMPRRG